MLPLHIDCRKGFHVFRTTLVLAAVSVMTVSLGAQPAPSGHAEKLGRKVFQTRCAMCHVGQDPATEMATDGERRAPTFGPLLSRNSLRGDAAALKEKIKNGGARMPAYKYALKDEQIDQVIAFMKTIERPLTQIAIARPGE
jgi:mono/diheme cytochrome c family protein